MKDVEDVDTLELPFKHAPLSNSERQKAYRERRKSDKSQRLDVYIDADVAGRLADMVGAAEESQKDVLTRLIEKEYKRLYAVKNRKLKLYVENKKQGTP